MVLHSILVAFRGFEVIPGVREVLGLLDFCNAIPTSGNEIKL